MPAPKASDVGANIEHYTEKGRSRKQAIAIALSRKRKEGGKVPEVSRTRRQPSAGQMMERFKGRQRPTVPEATRRAARLRQVAGKARPTATVSQKISPQTASGETDDMQERKRKIAMKRISSVKSSKGKRKGY